MSVHRRKGARHATLTRVEAGTIEEGHYLLFDGGCARCWPRARRPRMADQQLDS